MEYNNYYPYITIQGDSFDMIALDYYNEENYASVLIEANSEYRDIIVFDEGITLIVPIIEQKASPTLPPWKR